MCSVQGWQLNDHLFALTFDLVGFSDFVQRLPSPAFAAWFHGNHRPNRQTHSPERRGHFLSRALPKVGGSYTTEEKRWRKETLINN